MMFFTLGSSATPRWAEWATTRVLTFTTTFLTPATLFAAATSALRKAGIWLFAG